MIQLPGLIDPHVHFRALEQSNVLISHHSKIGAGERSKNEENERIHI